MGNILPPPSTNVPLVMDRKNPERRIDVHPVWRKWLMDLSDIINKSGGSLGSVAASRRIDTQTPITGGGDLSEDRTLVFVAAGLSGDVQVNSAGALSSVTGISATVVTAKRTGVGAEGSMTFVNGVLTAQVQAT